jgi:hypothetical protein
MGPRGNPKLVLSQDNSESNKESDTNPRKLTPLSRMEGQDGAKKTSASRPTKKEKATKSNLLALPGHIYHLSCIEGLEGAATKTSTPRSTNKKKVTKSSLALPAPKDGQKYGKYEAYTILSSLEDGIVRSAVIDDWIEEGSFPLLSPP